MFARLLSALGVAAIRGEIASIVQRLRLRAILIALAVFLWLLAFAFALAAFAVWLSSELGAIAACAILAAAFAAAAIALHLWLRFMKRRSTPLVAGLSRSLAPLMQAANDARDSARAAAGADDPQGTPAAEAGSVGTLMVLAVLGYVMGRFLRPGDHSAPGSDR